MKFLKHLSLRTQIFLVFILCLGLLGAGTLFLNAFMIAGLKDRFHNDAVWLAEEQGRMAAAELARYARDRGVQLGDLGGDMSREIRVLVRGPKNVVAMAVLDPEGNVVYTAVNRDSEVLRVARNDDGTSLTLDTRGRDVSSIGVELLHKTPGLRSVEREFPIQADGHLLGRLRFLISDSPIYRDIEATGREITGRLRSVVLAFTGVLALGFYLIARLVRRQMHLLADNEKLDRMAYVGTLASGLAHEIRNPLNAMAMNLAVAEEELGAGAEGSAETARQAAALIRREIERMNRSVTGFLAFARPEAHRLQATDLKALMEEVLELLGPQIAASDATVEVDLPEHARLEADFSGLRQVLYNTLLNALQAVAAPENAGRPRRVSVGGRRESAQWLLWVEDTGPGIPPGDEAKVFEAFHTTKAGGSGFGLSIARAIVESHDGDIAARRTPKGGTRIEITLPETAPERLRAFA